jgi:hypothetical protein
MSKGKNQHVLPRGDEWAVKGAGNSKATKVVTTQKKQLKSQGQLQLIRGRKCLYMVAVDVLESVILTVKIISHQEDRI